MDRKRFAAALKLAFEATARRESGCLAEVRMSGGCLPTLDATDLDVAIRIPLMETPGGVEVAMLTRVALKVLSRVRGDEVDVEASEARPGGVTISAPGLTAEVSGSKADAMPDVVSPGVEAAEVPWTAVEREIRRALVYVSTDEARPTICDVRMEVRLGEGVRLLASDGHRAYIGEPIGEGVIDVDVRVSPAALKLAAAAAAVMEAESVSVSVSTGTPGKGGSAAVGMYVGGIEVISLAREVAYPDVRLAIGEPDPDAPVVTVDRRELQRAAEDCRVLSTYAEAPVALSGTDDGVVLRVESALGSMERTIAAETSGGGALAGRMRLSYLAQAAKAAVASSLAIHAGTGELDPIQISDGDALHVIMPTRAPAGQ